jgi:hypothetical protein
VDITKMPTLEEIQAILKAKREKLVSEVKTLKNSSNLKPPKDQEKLRSENIENFEPKDNVIGTRVSTKFFEVLLEYAKVNDIKLSKLTREALIFYDIYVIQRKSHNPIMIVPKNEYATILEHLNDEGIKRLVEVGFYNTCQEIEKIQKEIREVQGIDLNLRKMRLPPRMLMGRLKKTFSDQGQNWFKSFEYRLISKGNLMFAGLHDINKNFSLFMKYYLKKCLDRFTNYELIDEKAVLTDNRIVLHFQYGSNL